MRVYRRPYSGPYLNDSAGDMQQQVRYTSKNDHLGASVQIVATCHQRRYWPNRATSAIHPIATVPRTSLDFRNVPTAEMPASFDHLVGAGEQRRRHVEAERLGGLEVDHQLVLGRRLHRQVGRLLALEDAVDVAGRAPVLVDAIRPIGDQAAGGDEEAFVVDRGQLVPGRQRDDQIAMNAPPTRSPSRSGRHSGSARRPRRRARSRRRRAC